MSTRSRRIILWSLAALAAICLILFASVALFVAKPELAVMLGREYLASHEIKLEFDQCDFDTKTLSLHITDLKIETKDKNRVHLDDCYFQLNPKGVWEQTGFLHTVALTGLDLRLSPPPDETGPEPQRPPLWLLPSDSLEIRHASISLEQGGYVISLTNLSGKLWKKNAKTRLLNLQAGLTVKVENGAPLVNGRLRATGQAENRLGPDWSLLGQDNDNLNIETDIILEKAKLNLPWLRGDIHFLYKANITGAGTSLDRVEVRMPNAELLSPTTSRTLRTAINVSASGYLDASLRALSLSLQRLTLGRLGWARGDLMLNRKGISKLQLTGLLSSPLQLVSLFAPDDLDLSGLELRGHIPIDINHRSQKEDESIEVETQLKNLWLMYQGINLRLSGPLSLTTRKPFDRITLDGGIKAKGGYQGGGILISNLNAWLPISGRADAPGFPGWRVSIPSGGLLYQGRQLNNGEIKAKGNGELQGTELSLDLKELTWPDIGGLTGKLTIRGDKTSLKARIAGMEAEGALKALEASNLLPVKGWAAQGKLSLNLDAVRNRNKVAWKADLGLLEFGVNSPDDVLMAQGLAGTLNLSGGAWGVSSLAAELNLNQGEALWKTFYIDLTKRPVSLNASGLPGKDGAISDIDLTFDWDRAAKLSARGDYLPGAIALPYRGRLTLEHTNLTPVFETLIKEPFAPELPELSDMAISGKAWADLTFSDYPKGAKVRGLVKIRDLDFRQGNQTQPAIEKMQVDLPVHYILGLKRKVKAAAPGPDEKGRVSLKALRINGARLSDINLPISLVPNRLRVQKTLRTPLLGGHLAISDLWLDQPFSAGFNGGFKASLKGLDLSHLSTDEFRIKGRLAGRLDRVSFNTSRLKARGELKGSLYGGALRLSDLGITNPLSPGRGYFADVSLKKMDLEQFSKASGIGLVTGKLDVMVAGLRMAYGQPVAFNLKAKSVDQDQISQTVSLEAVNSISVLGTGVGLTGLGVSLMQKVFSELPYEEIGFACTLKNDTFGISGLIREDGVEYLVKKPPLLGINVVNQNLNNQISWSGMIERLKRVTQDSATRPES